MTRLAIVCTHPIQYYAPVFGELARGDGLEVRVFYGWQGATKAAFDPGFGQSIAWDIPLLDGYDYEFVTNVAKDPGSHRYRGIDLPTLCKRIAGWSADAILVYGWCYKAHLRAMRYFNDRIPVFFRGDSTLLNASTGLRGFVRKRVLSWVYGHVDVAFYVGTENRRYYQAFGLADHQLVFAPHAVDNRRFARTREIDAESQRLRRSLGIEEDAVAILLPAKLESVKSPEVLLEAFAQLQSRKVHLLFAGSGPLESSLRERQVPRAHFLGFQNQSKMPSIYHASDVVVLASQSETWGLALNEAMAAGRAVIASDRVGAAIDLIEPERNGWIVEANSIDGLARRLEQSLEIGRHGLHSLGTRSLNIIQDWSIGVQATAIRNSVLDHNRTSAGAR